jgi:hypothetical protein
VNPFDRLVLDEPPIRLDVDDLIARGRSKVRRRRLGAAMGTVLLAAGVVAVSSVLDMKGPDRLPTEQQRYASQPVVPPGRTEPSQSTADATRDGVLPAVAALPFAERIKIVEQVESPEGVWAISRIPGGPGTLGDPAGRPGIDRIQRQEYGEIVLLDPARTRIARAYPLHTVPPQQLLLHHSGVYCARQGDGALPTSMICRIDRSSLGLTVRVFRAPGGPGSEPSSDDFNPTWLRDPEPAPDLLRTLLTCGDRACVEGQAGRAKIEPSTLELRRYADGVNAPPASKIDRTDDFGMLTLGPSGRDILIDVDRVDMLGGEEAEAAASARGDEVSNDYYLVNDNPQLRRYRLSADAVVWGSLGLGRTVEHQPASVDDLLAFLRTDTPQSRNTLFHLHVDDGWIVGVEEQYRP